MAYSENAITHHGCSRALPNPRIIYKIGHTYYIGPEETCACRRTFAGYRGCHREKLDRIDVHAVRVTRFVRGDYNFYLNFGGPIKLVSIPNYREPTAASTTYTCITIIYCYTYFTRDVKIENRTKKKNNIHARHTTRSIRYSGDGHCAGSNVNIILCRRRR